MDALTAWSTLAIAVIAGATAVPLAWRALILVKRRRQKKANERFWGPVVMAVLLSAVVSTLIAGTSGKERTP